MATDPLVVVGAGHAAGQFVASLAQEGYRGALILVGDETYPPYQRPPLSKKFLAGEIEQDRLYLKPIAFYEKVGTRLLLQTQVTGIDRPGKTILLADGSRLGYATLVLATGCRPRRLTLPGADLPGVFYLRTIADVLAIRPRLALGKSLAVVGGGYIGLELAAVAVKHGLRVTVLEQAPRLMARAVGPVVSAFYARLHREEGVDVRLATAVLGFDGKDALERVRCEDGDVEADLAVVGIGAVPNTELARDAGLVVDDGIAVDAHCRTEDPAIFAIGDCTNQFSAIYGRRLRLESVHNALEQARIAAATICGKTMPAPQVPWFWSDQYDTKLQTVGISAGHDEQIVRGSPQQGRSFAVCCLRGEVLIAVDALNRMAEFMSAKPLIAERAKVDRCKLADERVALKDCRL